MSKGINSKYFAFLNILLYIFFFLLPECFHELMQTIHISFWLQNNLYEFAIRENKLKGDLGAQIIFSPTTLLSLFCKSRGKKRERREKRRGKEKRRAEREKEREKRREKKRREREKDREREKERERK